MEIKELRNALATRAKDTGGDPEAVERLALNFVLGLPVDVRNELAEITADLDEGGWNFVAQKAGRLALVATDQAQRIERRRPPRLAPRLTSVPRIREMHWCDFPDDAQLPEFWKTRPVLVISYKQRTFGDAVTVIPCSSLEQDRNAWAVKLSKSLTQGVDSWAICDKPTTVAISRLTANRGKTPRLDPEEFEDVLKRVLEWLPVVPPKKEGKPSEAAEAVPLTKPNPKD